MSYRILGWGGGETATHGASKKHRSIDMRGDQCQNCDVIVVGVVVGLEGGNIHEEGVYFSERGGNIQEEGVHFSGRGGIFFRKKG